MDFLVAGFVRALDLLISFDRATWTITTAIALETNKGMFADGIAFMVNICLSFLKRQ